MSRIDYIFGSDLVLALLQYAAIHDIVILDHAPIEVTLQDFDPRPQTAVCRLPACLVQDNAFQDMVKQAWEEYSACNAQHLMDPNLFWEAEMAFLRGHIMAFTSARKKTH